MMIKQFSGDNLLTSKSFLERDINDYLRENAVSDVCLNLSSNLGDDGGNDVYLITLLSDETGRIGTMCKLFIETADLSLALSH